MKSKCIKLTNEAKIFQWFLDTPSLSKILNWPIQVDLLCESAMKLHCASKRDSPCPNEIAQLWREFVASMGPTVTFNVFHDEHWRHLVPPVSVPSEDTRAVVWEGDHESVICEVVFDEHGNGINQKFVVKRSHGNTSA